MHHACMNKATLCLWAPSWSTEGTHPQSLTLGGGPRNVGVLMHPRIAHLASTDCKKFYDVNKYINHIKYLSYSSLTIYNELKTIMRIIIPYETEYTHLVNSRDQMGGHQCGTWWYPPKQAVTLGCEYYLTPKMVVAPLAAELCWPIFRHSAPHCRFLCGHIPD